MKKNYIIRRHKQIEPKGIKQLDLHEFRHHQVHNVVEDFILMTSEPVLKIITGNSNRMLELVVEVLCEYGFKYEYESWSNLGSIIAYEYQTMTKKI